MHVVKRIAISSRNVLSKCEKETVAVDPKIWPTRETSNSDTHYESQNENPYQLAVKRQYRPNAASNKGTHYGWRLRINSELAKPNWTRPIDRADSRGIG